MRVLVTRPLIDAEETAAALRARGHAPVLAPLMTITHDTGASEALARALQGAQGIAFTSANGVRAFAALNARRDAPVITVGPASAASARDAGFNTVFAGDGGAQSLLKLAGRQFSSAGGPLVHVAGTHLAATSAGGLKRGLEALGFELRRAVIYEAAAALDLPGPLRRELMGDASPGLEAALFYSPRSAALFRDLVIRAGLAQACGGLKVFCISAATAQALSPLAFKSVDAAPTPNGQALLDLLE